jgi:hypothetical protein
METDEALWPIVVHRTVGIPTDGQIDAFIARADHLLARQVAHVVIFDNTAAGRASPYMRKRSMDWLKANQTALTKYCLGTALVIRSPALRFVMSTVMLVVSQPVPHDVFATLGQAVGWARERLEERTRLVG